MTVLRTETYRRRLDKMDRQDVITHADRVRDARRSLIHAADRLVNEVADAQATARKDILEFQGKLGTDTVYAIEHCDGAIRAAAILSLFGGGSYVPDHVNKVTTALRAVCFEDEPSVRTCVALAREIMAMRDAVVAQARLASSGLTSSSSATRTLAQEKIATCLDYADRFGALAYARQASENYVFLVLNLD